MPTYAWKCTDPGCGSHWDVVSTVADRDSPSPCPACSASGARQITIPNIDKTAAGGWNQQSFNPGLGCWTKNQKHASQIAKERGLIEVGNEPPENMIKAAERQREETRQARWDDAMSEKSIREVIG